MAEEIRVLLMYEILGRPPEHIKEALEKFVMDFNDKKGIRLESSKVHEPKLLEEEHKEGAELIVRENAEELFTTFAEVELLVDNLNILFNIILNTLPANVEVLEPSSLRLNNFDLSGVLSELTIKLHKYDEVAKVLTIERSNLIKQLNKIKEESNPKEPTLNLTTNIRPEEEFKEEVKPLLKEKKKSKKKKKS